MSKSFTLTDVQYGHLIDMLEFASEKLGAQCCNDYDVANSDENWAMVKEDLELDDEDRPAPDQAICTYDWMVADFVIRRIKEQAEANSDVHD